MACLLLLIILQSRPIRNSKLGALADVLWHSTGWAWQMKDER